MSTQDSMLYVRTASGRYRPADAPTILAVADEVRPITIRGVQALVSPDTVKAFLKAQLKDRQYEAFCCIYLDNRHKVLGFQELFRGTIDGASVHPREVVRECIGRNAAAVIIAHNHPSAVAEPSQADELITRRLVEALALVDIRVVDHLIVAGDDVLSFAERGLI